VAIQRRDHEFNEIDLGEPLRGSEAIHHRRQLHGELSFFVALYHCPRLLYKDPALTLQMSDQLFFSPTAAGDQFPLLPSVG
jgi:hypothetical protein